MLNTAQKCSRKTDCNIRGIWLSCLTVMLAFGGVLVENSAAVGQEKIAIAQQAKDHAFGLGFQKTETGAAKRFDRTRTIKPVKEIKPDEGDRRQGKSFATRFLEVEVILNGQFTLADISALPRAPGSDLKVLHNPERVVVQLQARRVEALVGKGAKISVLKKFVLVEGVKEKTYKREGSGTPKAICSGPYCEGSNTADYPIPENNWTHSDICIACAPGNAVVACIDVHYEIIHTCVSDLDVDLTDENLGHEYRLWGQGGGCTENINQTERGITDFNGETVNQCWQLWAADWYQVDFGHIDSWWVKVYYEEISPPDNDDCSAAIPVTAGVSYEGSTVGATGIDESSCAPNDPLDVWHAYTPTSSALVTISLAGSSFDTTLAVFDACGGTELACNDDVLNEVLQSEITMAMAKGSAYLIRIAGYNEETGNYTIRVSSEPCLVPDAPSGSSPANGATDVPVDAVLSWDGGEASGAKIDESAATASKGTMIPKVIYGPDDRLDEYQVTNPNLLAVGDSTVVIVPKSELINNGNGTFSLPTETYSEWYLSADPLGTGNPLCTDEPYRDQQTADVSVLCSGFLVAPDIISTTGHCLNSCGELAFVFGFVMLDPVTPRVTIDESEIHYCSEVIHYQTGDADWALIRLDREVIGHNPLSVRTTGKIPDDERLLVIGHPVALPRKYAGGATTTVRHNTTWASFEANLDTYVGNSGAAVLSQHTLQVEGILGFGQEDWVAGAGCDRSNQCSDEGCPGWEEVTRANQFTPFFPWQKYDVYLDINDPPTKLICSDIDLPACTPSETLEPFATYYWRVVSRNSCGHAEGPVWSFTSSHGTTRKAMPWIPLLLLED